MEPGAQQPRPDKVALALQEGHLWRAREILAGRIGSGRYDAQTYEQLGALLLRMGDDLQAGRYLFLSGERRPEYRPAIDLFITRHGRGGWQSLVGAFPNAAKRCAWSELPAAVRQDLRAAGVPVRRDSDVLARTLRSHPPGGPGPFGCTLLALGVLGAGVLLAWGVAYFFADLL